MSSAQAVHLEESAFSFRHVKIARRYLDETSMRRSSARLGADNFSK